MRLRWLWLGGRGLYGRGWGYGRGYFGFGNLGIGQRTTRFEDDAVHVNDLNATILHQLGIDHRRLTFRYQGLDQRLTGVEEAHVVGKILG